MVKEQELCQQWLAELKDLMAVYFVEQGLPLRNNVFVAYNLNWLQRRGVAGTCTYFKDQDYYLINIAPHPTTTMDVAGVLCHELIHALGNNATSRKRYMSHGATFGRACTKLGLLRPWYKTNESPAFKEWVSPMIDKLGRKFPCPNMCAENGYRFNGYTWGKVKFFKERECSYEKKAFA